MLMYVYCSECGWRPDEFLDLTRRQLSALQKGRERWIEKQTEAAEKAQSGRPQRPAKSRKNYRERINNVHYDRENETKSVVGDGPVSSAVRDGSGKGSIKPSDASGMIDGLAQSGALKSRIWRGGIKKENRPKTKEEKLRRMRAQMSYIDKKYGADQDAS